MITQAAGSVGYAKKRWSLKWKNGAKVHGRRVLRMMRTSKAADEDEKLRRA